jgi:hypothetical protein
MAEQQQQQIQIKADEKTLKGVYSNIVQISHMKEEFVLDFFMVAAQNGTLNSRIILNPSHVKRLATALADNIKKYEEQFGKIEETAAPEQKVGFGN